MTENRPLILLDVDGVIRSNASARARRHLCYYDGWKQRHVWWGPDRVSVCYNPAMGPPLRKLVQETGAELAWGTMWEDWANISIGPLWGLPQLPVAPTLSGWLSEGYKARSVVPWTAGRPFVWFDDDIGELDEAQRLCAGRSVLLVQVDEREGLTEDNIKVARNWLLAKPWETDHQEEDMPQETTTPKPVEGFAVGDTIEHRLMPGFETAVLGKKPCEPYPVHPSEHPQYLVRDPEGDEDWVCHYDMQAPGADLPYGVPE